MLAKYSGQEQTVQAPFEDMSLRIENAQIDVLLVFRSVDVTADASGGVRGAYVLLDGFYMKENR